MKNKDRIGAAEGFDGFISYSHAADEALASALRRALQRFANPWSPISLSNRVRALRIFRDQSALSPNAELWPTIERALRDSDWLILLASVDSAASPWIARELTWWRHHKPATRILLALTDGDLVWDQDSGDFQRPESTALPPCLLGTFEHEPLWLDLRWTRTMEYLDARDPRFVEVVASLAASLRGISKDRLIGEDLRQHRRLSWWRNGAIFALLVLLLGAILAADLARRQRGIALEREAEAVAERNRALRQAEISLARQLAASSVQIRLESIERIEQSLLLAIESVRRERSMVGYLALTQALALVPARSARYEHKWGPAQPYSMVLGVAFGPQGKRLASVNEDGSVALWDSDAGLLWHEAVSGERLRQLAFTANGESLAVGGDAGRVSLLDIVDGSELLAIDHDDRITGVAFAADDRVLVTASEDGKLRVSDAGNGREIAVMDFGDGDYAEVEDLALDPGGAFVAAISEGGRLCLLRLDSKPARPCMFTRAQGLEVAVSADGRKVAAAAENIVQVWDVASGENENRFAHVDLQGFAKMAHWNWLNDVAFDPGGRFLATAGRDRSARLWDLESGLEAVRMAHSGPVSRLAFSPDGRLLATVTDVGTVRVWEVPSGAELFRMGNGSGSTIQTLAFSPDGQRLAIGDWNGQIHIWTLKSALETARLWHEDDVELVAISPDGRWIATATDDNKVHLWDRERGVVVRTVERFNPERLLFAVDSRHLLIEMSFGRIDMISLDGSGTVTRLAERLRGSVFMTPRYVVHGSGSRLDIWRSDGGEPLQQAVAMNLPIKWFYVPGDAGIIAIAYEGGVKIDIWNIMEARVESSVPAGEGLRSAVVSPAGDRIAVLYAERPVAAGRYDPLEYRLEIRGLRDADEPVLVVPLGKNRPELLRFVTGSERMLIMTGNWQFPDDAFVLDLADPGNLIPLEDVQSAKTLRATPDGRHLLINDGDRVRVWDLDSGRAVAQMMTSGAVDSAIFTPDGRHIATTSRDNSLILWRWQIDELIERACEQLGRNFSTEEWQDFLPGVPYRETCPATTSDSR